MKKAAFLVLVPMLYTLSWLPLSILYFIGDVIFIFIFYVFPYRKSVVMDNLRRSFPDKTTAELKAIRNRFYRNFTEMLMENIKLLTISKKEVLGRVTFVNPELLKTYFDKSQSLMAIGAHYSSWELGGFGLCLVADHTILAIYKPLSNEYFDQLMQNVRGRFGTVPVKMNNIARVLLGKEHEPSLTVFIADQGPLRKEDSYWVEFLGQDTPVYSGPEKLARKFTNPVIFCHTKRVRRGHYSVEFILLTDDPASLGDEEITRLHTKTLEKIIKEEPASWLWTHKRWKKVARWRAMSNEQ